MILKMLAKNIGNKKLYSRYSIVARALGQVRARAKHKGIIILHTNKKYGLQFFS